MSTVEESKTKQKKGDPERVGVADLADRLGVDPRSLRQWLRAEGEGLGQRGKRYEFTSKQALEVERRWKAAQGGDQD